MSLINFTKSLTESIKEYASKKEGNVILSANLYETWLPETDSIHGVTGIILAPYYDVTYIERNTRFLPPYQTNIAVYKAGLAANGFRKPVWVSEWTLWFSNPYEPEDPPDDISYISHTIS